MSTRFAILAATASLVAISSPAFAHEGHTADRYAQVEHSAVHSASRDDHQHDVRHDAGRSGHHDTRHDGMSGDHHAERSGPRFAYGDADREEWLAQCRSLNRAYYESEVVYDDDDYDNEGDTDILGGILGAVVGGIAGNRIGGSGDRLAGTLIGAGVGGIAGAVIGSIIDGVDDDDYDDYDDRVIYEDDGRKFGYCEAYLLNYERGHNQPSQIAYAPVMMAPVHAAPQHQQRRHRHIVEEHVVAERTVPARARRVHRAPAPAPVAEPGKTQPIR